MDMLNVHGDDEDDSIISQITNHVLYIFFGETENEMQR